MSTLKKIKRRETNGRVDGCSIVIRCYNEEKYIGKLLHGISEQTIKNLEIVIVDSGSTDATLSIVSRYPVKIVTIRPEEFSFGRSLNTGCAETTKELIAIASAHVYPIYKDWLENLCTPFVDSQIGLVYGRQQGGKNTKFAEHQVFKQWFPDESNPDQPHPFCNNANAAIRRSLWESYPYNEELTGLEDIEWANRTSKSGHKIFYQSDAIIAHVHNEMPQQIFNRYRREAIAFKRIFPAEHFHFGDFINLFSQNVVSDYRQAINNKCKSRVLFEIPLFRFMQLWGTYQGFKKSGPVTSQLKQTFYYPNRSRKIPTANGPKNNHQQLINYSSKGRNFRANR